jgi:hypothetical protein
VTLMHPARSLDMHRCTSLLLQAGTRVSRRFYPAVHLRSRAQTLVTLHCTGLRFVGTWVPCSYSWVLAPTSMRAESSVIDPCILLWLETTLRCELFKFLFRDGAAGEHKKSPSTPNVLSAVAPSLPDDNGHALPLGRDSTAGCGCRCSRCK